MANFIHLRIHSGYSFDDSTLRLKEYILKDTKGTIVQQINSISQKAKEYQMSSLALTDKNNIFGGLEHFLECQNQQINPIIGCDITIYDEILATKTQLLLLVQNYQGYKNLSTLLSKGYENDDFYITKELLKQYNQGLIALSGFNTGDIAWAIENKPEQVERLVNEYKEIFENNFYLEIWRIYDKNLKNTNLLAYKQEKLILQTFQLAQKYDLPICATHPSTFLDNDNKQYQVSCIKHCINNNLTYTQLPNDYEKFCSREQYFKSAQEISELFNDMPEEVLLNSVEIANNCQLDLPTLNKNFLPHFDTGDVPTNDYFANLARSGLEKRLEFLYPDEKKREANKARYLERLEKEIQVIQRMDFAGYFLIVADFINWAKQNQIPVGPGRGSGVGSLVAYSLAITELDPLKYDLLFERFLNEERVSMPDFDVDFCQENRKRVIEYVRNKYGEAMVSQIATFGLFQQKSSIKDIGRALRSGTYELTNNFCKLLEKSKGFTDVIDDGEEKDENELEDNSYINVDIYKWENEQDREFMSQIIDISTYLQGLPRAIGTHAGGVIISPTDINDFVPLYNAEGVKITQFEKNNVEKIGLVKFDFLGLKNLTVIDNTLKLIAKRNNFHPQLNLSADATSKDISSQIFNGDWMEDKATFRLLRRGLTNGVFQLENNGIQKTIKNLSPDNFEDIIALLALYRPGPLGSGMVQSFINRKKGKENIDYFGFSELKSCLSSTYGVILYQEQVMQIAQIIAGYTLGAADELRRAMGKKKPEVMAKHRSIFLEGARKKNPEWVKAIGTEEIEVIDNKTGEKKKVLQEVSKASKLFDLMEKFAEYGFNKSHSAAYALITLMTAYLKSNYAIEYMCSCLNGVLKDTDKIEKLFKDLPTSNLQLKRPNINLSYAYFEPRKDNNNEKYCLLEKTDKNNNCIEYGLEAIKNVNLKAINWIVSQRQEKEFTSFEDFCARLMKQKVFNKSSLVNKKMVQNLIFAGAFDKIAPFKENIKFLEEQVQSSFNQNKFNIKNELNNYLEKNPLILQEKNLTKVEFLEKQYLLWKKQEYLRLVKKYTNRKYLADNFEACIEYYEKYYTQLNKVKKIQEKNLLNNETLQEPPKESKFLPISVEEFDDETKRNKEKEALGFVFNILMAQKQELKNDLKAYKDYLLTYEKNILNDSNNYFIDKINNIKDLLNCKEQLESIKADITNDYYLNCLTDEPISIPDPIVLIGGMVESVSNVFEAKNSNGKCVFVKLRDESAVHDFLLYQKNNNNNVNDKKFLLVDRILNKEIKQGDLIVFQGSVNFYLGKTNNNKEDLLPNLWVNDFLTKSQLKAEIKKYSILKNKNLPLEKKEILPALQDLDGTSSFKKSINIPKSLFEVKKKQIQEAYNGQIYFFNFENETQLLEFKQAMIELKQEFKVLKNNCLLTESLEFNDDIFSNYTKENFPIFLVHTANNKVNLYKISFAINNQQNPTQAIKTQKDVLCAYLQDENKAISKYIQMLSKEDFCKHFNLELTEFKIKNELLIDNLSLKNLKKNNVISARTNKKSNEEMKEQLKLMFSK